MSLKDVLPVAGEKAAKEAATFRSKLPVPKGAVKSMVTSAIDYVVTGKKTLAEAVRILTQTETDYVLSVLSERDQWLIENGFAKTTTLRDDQMLQEEAAKAIEESK